MTISKARARFLAGAVLIAAAGLAGPPASAEPNRVTFPDKFAEMVHYTTVTRGTTDEIMLTTKEAIEALKAGQAVPDGTHFVLQEHRNGTLYRYFIMQKGKDWGADYDPRRRTGDWQFQWFTPAKEINLAENTARCQSCHGSRSANDFLFTTDKIQPGP